MRKIDTNKYVSVLRNLVEEDKEVGLLISGNSMAPFLVHERDYIYFKKPDRPLQPGDMVFYQRENGQFIMHRIFDIRDNGYYMLGDDQFQIEGPLQRSQIFALVTKVKRNGKVLGPEDFLWKFFRGPWRKSYSLRRFLFRVCRRIKMIAGKGEDN
ncbi:MAG: S24/S26 family peptidase [Eubacterium sp.]|nr:S24/S26 family peptidase [Eubacterium sp.]